MENNMEEQTNNRQHGHTTSRKTNNTSKIIISGAVVLVATGVGFFGGVQYQKGKAPSETAGQQINGYGMGGMNGGFGGPVVHRGEFGTVTDVSSTSISLKSDRTGETKTYTINSSTTFIKNGASATASDIAVGDTAMVEASSSDSSVAASIDINPSMNGGPMNSPSTNTQTN